MLARQVLQSRAFRYHAGSGIISVGAISTITDDTYFNCFPSIQRMATADLLLVYTKSINAGEGGDTSPNVVGKTSSNEGSSFTAEFEVYDPPIVVGASCQGLTVLSPTHPIAPGRLIVPVSIGSEGTLGGAAIIYSDNNSGSWTYVTLSTSFSPNEIVVGPACELPNGDLLITVEGYNSGQAVANRSSHTLCSTDGGATWGSEVTIADYATYGVPFYEAQLIRIGATIWSISHNDSIARISRSDNLGGSWGAPATAFAIQSRPTVRRLLSGTVMVVGRDLPGNGSGTIAYTSIDRLASWSAKTVIDASHYMVYADIVALLDGTYMVTFSSEVSGTNADIKWAVVTETA